MLRALTIATALLLSTPAAAVCDAPYSTDALENDLDRFDSFAIVEDMKNAKRVAAVMTKNLTCLDALASTDQITRFARSRGLVDFYRQEPDAASRWVAMSLTSGDTAVWPAGFTPDHPFRVFAQSTELPTASAPEGQGLAPPKSGAVFLNGRFLAEPRAYPEVPGFVQVTDKKGNVSMSFWQEGALFPEWLLGPDKGPMKFPKWYEPTGR